jgi:hypothetical protein
MPAVRLKVVPNIPKQNHRPQCASQAGTTGIAWNDGEIGTAHGMLRIGSMTPFGDLRRA